MSDSPPTDTNIDLEGEEPDDVTVIEIQEEMESSFLDYAMSVIISRALPDARDGLKPSIAGFCGRCTIRDSGPIEPTSSARRSPAR